MMPLLQTLGTHVDGGCRDSVQVPASKYNEHGERQGDHDYSQKFEGTTKILSAETSICCHPRSIDDVSANVAEHCRLWLLRGSAS